MSQAFDPTTTYVHLTDDGSARLLPVGAELWATIAERTDLDAGRLVTAFEMHETWNVWEMHPAGDELVVLLRGDVDLVLEQDGGTRTIPLRGRGAFLIPAGAWHTMTVHAPSELLFVTPGAGTEHRPVEANPRD